jgi:hypothetical protein
LDDKFPGASWLPLIYQNPTVIPPSWDQLKTPKQEISYNKVSQFFLEEPEGTVPLNSPFYVERPPIESECYEIIVREGALIRIKAPRQMGKTSLLTRILHHTKQQNCRTVYISFQEADRKVFADLDQFLQWFCTSVTTELEVPNKLDDYWQNTYEGSKDKCKSYFKRYLLAGSDNPMVLGLDEVDRIFQHPEIADEFFGLLRAWHERGKNENVWKKLRLIITHSKEVYTALDMNQSPFNVGKPVDLPELNLSQVKDLGERHELNCSKKQVEQLMTMVGGHSYLVRIAFYQIARQKMTLAKLLQVAPTESGPYSDHLRRLLLKLKEKADLTKAFKRMIVASKPILVKEIEEAFRLRSMGLIKFQEDDTVIPLCNLYCIYFRNYLKD